MVDRGDQHEQGTVRWRGVGGRVEERAGSGGGEYRKGQVEGRAGPGGGEGGVRWQVAGNKDPTLHPALPLRSPGLEHFPHRTSELGLLPVLPPGGAYESLWLLWAERLRFKS